MTVGDYVAIIALIINITGVLTTVGIYSHTVKQNRKLITITDFSKIREKYPNVSPKAICPVSDEERLKYLREMERFCTGVNSKIYDFDTINQTSGHLLIKQYDDYMRDIINQRRKSADETWKYFQYEEVIKKLILKKQGEK